MTAIGVENVNDCWLEPLLVVEGFVVIVAEMLLLDTADDTGLLIVDDANCKGDLVVGGCVVVAVIENDCAADEIEAGRAKSPPRLMLILSVCN